MDVTKRKFMKDILDMEYYKISCVNEFTNITEDKNVDIYYAKDKNGGKYLLRYNPHYCSTRRDIWKHFFFIGRRRRQYNFIRKNVSEFDVDRIKIGMPGYSSFINMSDYLSPLKPLEKQKVTFEEVFSDVTKLAHPDVVLDRFHNHKYIDSFVQSYNNLTKNINGLSTSLNNPGRLYVIRFNTPGRLDDVAAIIVARSSDKAKRIFRKYTRSCEHIPMSMLSAKLYYKHSDTEYRYESGSIGDIVFSIKSWRNKVKIENATAFYNMFIEDDPSESEIKE